jgi:hypothetical protein
MAHKLTSFISQQQKYIESLHNASKENCHTQQNKDTKYYDFKKLCYIANIEYNTMIINNAVTNNIINYNGVLKKITENIEQFGWMIIFNHSYNYYKEPIVEWCVIADSIIGLAQKYYLIYFHFIKKGNSKDVSLAIYYSIILSMIDQNTIGKSLCHFITNLSYLFNQNEKEIVINEVSSFYKDYQENKKKGKATILSL